MTHSVAFHVLMHTLMSTTSLLHLPAELLLLVANFLDREGDINSLVQANSRIYALLNPYLYRRNSLNSQTSELLWAAQRGSEATART
jgi:hypothetical protein